MPLRPYLATLAGSACIALALGGATPTMAAAPRESIQHSGHPRDDHDGRPHHEYHWWWHAHHDPVQKADGAKATAAPKAVAGTTAGATPSHSNQTQTDAPSNPTAALPTGSSRSTTPSSRSSTTAGATAAPSGTLSVGRTIGGRTVAEILHLTATAYGPSLQDNYPYGPVDAFGKPLVAGDVAVDPRVIPLNTDLYVAGYRSPYLPKGGEMAVARDTGGAIKGARIDIFINGSAQQVASFGVQPVTVYVLK